MLTLSRRYDSVQILILTNSWSQVPHFSALFPKKSAPKTAEVKAIDEANAKELALQAATTAEGKAKSEATRANTERDIAVVRVGQCLSSAR